MAFKFYYGHSVPIAGQKVSQKIGSQLVKDGMPTVNDLRIASSYITALLPYRTKNSRNINFTYRFAGHNLDIHGPYIAQV